MASEQNFCANAVEHFTNPQPSSIAFQKCEKLNYEEERIKSFASWPVHFPVDPNRLAKAGFFYTGNADEVVCFSCQGHIKNWNYGDIVLKKHADLYPNCNFIKNRSNNVPLLKTSVKSKSQTLIIEDANINNNQSKSDVIDFNKMKSESERLQTFSSKWPLSYINVSDLAHAGFFYTGIGCKVQCPYCKGVISNWDVNSIPIQEHLKQFPWCDLIQNFTQTKGLSWFQSSSQDICGNIIKQTSANSNSAPQSTKHNHENQHTNLEDLGVHLYKGPVHPQQASLTARLRSFATWSSSAPVPKEELAAAGFFYIGIGDRTICFHCNGGLYSWEKGDDPWVEHARWFSTCDFLHLNKGSDFIRACAIKESSKVKENYSYEFGGFNPKEPILKRVDEAMNSNLVKYVIETELFPLHIVRAALLLRIKQTGSTFTSIGDLCDAASHLKEELEKQSFDVKPVQAEDLNITTKFSESCSVSELPSVGNPWHSVAPKFQETHSEEKDLKSDSSEKSNSLEEDDLNDQYVCKICMDRKVGVVFLPCGHLHACTICASALKHCPMCRKSIQATVRVYLD